MGSARQRAAALALALAMTALQLWLAAQGTGARRASDAAERLPPRIEVVFAQILQPGAPAAAPPAAPAPAPRPPKPARAAEAPAAAASAAAQASTPPAPPPEPTPAFDAAEFQGADPWPQALAAAASTAASAAASAPFVEGVAEAAAVAAPAAPVAAAPAFDWPLSTRLRYALTGYYRGPIEGRAQVEWLRSGTRYQVHLDVTIGAPFAPLITRQMSSDGELGPGGLVPGRYDERTRLLWNAPRVLGLRFEPGAVRLANGRRVARPDGVQDAVSQFVQLTWRFTLQPGLLVTGRQVELPLALPRHVDTWVYDVREAETLATPAGPVEAVRLQPRRVPRPGGDLVAEMWFAPTLQYLPVRILIRQDAETYVDLLLDRLPEQAAPPAAPPVPTSGLSESLRERPPHD